MISFKKLLGPVACLLFILGPSVSLALAAEQTADGLANQLVQVSSTTSTTQPLNLADQEPASLATALPIEAADLGVPEPSFWQFFKRKFLRLFSFKELRRLRFDVEIAKLTLLKARQASNLGDTVKAEELLSDYQAKVENIAERIGALAQNLRGTNLQLNQLLDQIEQDLVLEAALIEQLGQAKAALPQKKLSKFKIGALEQLAKLLTKENLTPEQLAQKINQLSDKFAQKEAKIEKKIGKRLSLLDNLEEADATGKLEGGLEGAENQVAKEVAQAQNQTLLGQIVREIKGSTRKHLIVLQKVLDQVPEQAKPAIQAVIDKELEKITERLKSDPDLLNKLFKPTRFWDARLKLLERLRTHFKDTEEKAQEVIEKAQKKQGLSQVPPESQETPVETPQETKTQSEIIEVKSGRLSPARIEVEKDTKLTVRFQNQDRTERALTFSNGLATPLLPPRGITEIVLTIIVPLEFSVEGVGKGEIVLK